MTTKLIGQNDATPGGYGGAGYQNASRFQAEAAGDMTEFKVKCNSSGTLSYAVYADNNGSPAARLAQQAAPQSVVSGWNTLAISAVSLVSGTYYWLAVYIAGGDIGYSLTGGTRKYKSGASAFADPFDNTGFTDDAVAIFSAGWGDAVTLKASGDSGTGADAGMVQASFSSNDQSIGTESTCEAGLPPEHCYSVESGCGTDAVKAVIQKQGSGFRLNDHPVESGMPYKEVNL